MESLPLVSVILTTHERPHFLPIAFECYRHQTYPNRELIVVDDGAQWPVAASDVSAAGGRLLRAEPQTPLGVKMNLGAGEARGAYCLKMDDDDWYTPGFLATLLTALQKSSGAVCQSTIAGLQPFLFFDLSRWELRRSSAVQISGATLLFARGDWQAQPFRPLPRLVDWWFVRDQVAAGAVILPVPALEIFLQVRHGLHLWTQHPDGRPMEEFLQQQQLYGRRPEDLLPGWAVSAYRQIQSDLLAGRQSKA